MEVKTVLDSTCVRVATLPGGGGCLSSHVASVCDDVIGASRRQRSSSSIARAAVPPVLAAAEKFKQCDQHTHLHTKYAVGRVIVLDVSHSVVVDKNCVSREER